MRVGSEHALHVAKRLAADATTVEPDGEWNENYQDTDAPSDGAQCVGGSRLAQR